MKDWIRTRSKSCLPLSGERKEPRLSGHSSLLSVLGTAFLAVALLLVLSQARGGSALANDGTQPPAKPAGLSVSTEPGSLAASVDWDDTSGATYYKVRWRVAGFGNSLNEGVEAQSSAASITVADYGEWVVRVQACNSAGCGAAAARRFAVAPAPTPTPTPTVTPTPTISVPAATVSVPGAPTGLKVGKTRTLLGLVVVPMDWDDVPGATHYSVRLRKAGPGNSLNAPFQVQSSQNLIGGFGSYGDWVVRVEACNDAGCGLPSAKRFEHTAPSTPTPAPTPEPQQQQTATPVPTVTPPSATPKDLPSAPASFRARGKAADSTTALLFWVDGESSKWRLTHQATDAEESSTVEFDAPPSPPSPDDNPYNYRGSSKRYRLSGLDCGKTYDFTIEGYLDPSEYDHRSEPWSESATTSANTAACEGENPPALSAPPALDWGSGETYVAINSHWITVYWYPISGVDSYRTEYRAVGEEDWDTFSETDDNYSIASVDDPLTILECETFYEFRLSSHGDGTTYKAEWGPSATYSRQQYSLDCPTAGEAPAAPTGFSSTSTEDTNAATLSWDDPQDSSITKYQYRLEDRDYDSGWQDIPDSDAETTSYTITGVPVNARYEGYLRAVNEHGAGQPASLRWVDIGW